jgi:Icc-related predicted phosphoesterase
MQILFVTDLHGQPRRYERTLELARQFRVPLVINGGDMLPHGQHWDSEREFIGEFLAPHLAEYDRAGIEYFCYFGNDDLLILDPLLDEICAKHPRVVNLAQRKVERGGFEFIGMNWVVDYPFRLKDRCRMDTREYEFQGQFGTALYSTPAGYREVADWPAHARTLPTLADELARLPRPADMARAVYVIHMPPARMGLDACSTGMEVGSEALHEFIRTNQPRVTLHGHIHESPQVTATWMAKLGRTLCIQPGQMGALTYVLLDLETLQAERHEG